MNERISKTKALAARLRLVPLVLSLLFALGCGDCVDVEDFVDIPEPDLPIVDPGDMGSADASDAGDAMASDMRRTPKDVNFQFDFGPPPDEGNAGVFELDGIVPATGPLEGGTLVRIEGTGLEDGSTVIFGLNQTEASLSGGALVMRTPPGSAPRPVTVKVIGPSGESRALTDGFTYVDDLRVESVVPDRVPTSGGVEVEIRGSGFQAPLGVSFGRDPALRIDVLGDDIIRAIAPARTRGLADVRVTTADDTAVLEDAVNYFEPLEIVSIEPASGLTAGGETVRINARGVAPEQRVFFGTNEATVQGFDVGGGWIDVVAPFASAAGSVDVFVEGVFDATVRTDGYLYRNSNTPQIAAVRPATGPLSGGNQVEITGFGLDLGPIAFDAVDSTIVTASETRAVVEVPAASTAADVDVTLSQGGMVVATSVDAYAYVPDLNLTLVNPSNGSSTGAETVTLTGTGFTGTTRVEFGGVSADFTVVSDTQIEVTTPAHSGGLVDVVLERGELSATLEDGFAYEESLEIWGFSPSRGSVAGGTFVSVRGRGFYGALTASLAGVEGTEVRRVDTNNLTFVTPSNPEGATELAVSSDDGRMGIGPYDYLYFDPASRFGGASGGPVDGAVNVTVFSLGGGPIPDAFVMLSIREDTPYQGFTDPNGMVTLSGPDVLGAQTVTATAAGYSTTTIQTMDAENITIFLNLLNPMGNPGPGQPAPRASVFGDISATGKLSDPDNEKTFDMAIVRTTQRTLRSGNPAPGQRGIVLGEGAYEITTRIGDMAIVGLCGEYNQDTEDFTPKLMAVERFVFLSDQDRKRVDLECDIPLDQTVNFKLRNTTYAPTGPNNNLVRVFWDFGFEGVFASPSTGRSFSDVVPVSGQPSPVDDLNDLRYIALGGSFTGEGAPFSQTILDQITDISTLVLMPELLDVAEPLSPQPGGVITGNVFRFEASSPPQPDFWYIVLRNDMGIPVYEWLLPGDETSAQLPDFPDFSSLPVETRPVPLGGGTFFGVVTGARVTGGHTYESWTYRDLGSENYSTFSVASWIVGLPGPN